MRPSLSPAPQALRVHYRGAAGVRVRAVGARVLVDRVPLPQVPARLQAAWAQEVAAMDPGDVSPLDLPRARARWPGYRRCVQAAGDGLADLGLPAVLADSAQALMACRGAPYHLDAERYGANAFCNLFVSDDTGLDLVFPVADQRIALQRGTLVVFDTGQPHAVVLRGQAEYRAEDYADRPERQAVFLTWELPIDLPGVSQALGTGPGTAAAGPLMRSGRRVSREGQPARLCPGTGRWR